MVKVGKWDQAAASGWLGWNTEPMGDEDDKAI